MIAHVPTLSPEESRAVEELLTRVLDAGLPLQAALLFGSKARGDDDADSDVDVMLVLGLEEELVEDAERVAEYIARAVRVQTGTEVETWVLADVELRRGRRTPMLVDALEDAAPLWPANLRHVPLAYTPEDAAFCAERLLEWIEAGGRSVRAAVVRGDRAAAAARVRDDVTRMATASLLLTGETRHRRRSTLNLFADRFVPAVFSPRILPALHWAAAAYPPDGGRGRENPPATVYARQTLGRGVRLAARMEREVVPWIVAEIGW